MEDAPEEEKIAVRQTDPTTEEKKEPIKGDKRSDGKKNDVPNKGNAKKAIKGNKRFHEPPKPQQWIPKKVNQLEATGTVESTKVIPQQPPQRQSQKLNGN